MAKRPVLPSLLDVLSQTEFVLSGVLRTRRRIDRSVVWSMGRQGLRARSRRRIRLLGRLGGDIVEEDVVVIHATLATFWTARSLSGRELSIRFLW